MNVNVFMTIKEMDPTVTSSIQDIELKYILYQFFYLYTWDSSRHRGYIYYGEKVEFLSGVTMLLKPGT